MTEQTGPDLWALADLQTPWCIHVAATLRIAEHIAAGVDEIAPLAAAAGCDAYALHRVLTYLVQKGIFTEPQPGRFGLNAPARQLLDPGARMGLNLDGIAGRMAHAWTTLLAYVRAGQPAYDQVFGRGFWEDLEAHPDLKAEFDAMIGPAGHGMPDPRFEITGGWEPVRAVVDVGGGTGAMLAEVLRARPHLRGTLVDLPPTAAQSAPIFAAAGVAERASAVGQSFFDPLPPGADVYWLRGILNDWDDPESVQILRRCAEAARPNGRVIVLGSVRPDDAPQPIVIEMVLLGGKHRTVTEMKAIAAQAGLEVVQAQQQEGYFVTECVPRAA